MTQVERVSLSGTTLSYLLRECVASSGPQEGFLLGNVTQEITNHISDSQQDNSVTEVVTNVISVLPSPDTGLFYYPSGKIKEKVVKEMVSDAALNVIGWYKYHKNNSLKPTMRDRIVSRGLQKFFEKYNKKNFMCCNITCRQSSGNATHSYSYRFSKINGNGEIEIMDDSTSNLGEKVSGYKRGFKGDRDDPFNKAVRGARGKGMDGIAEAVEKALSDAANDAIEQEKRIRNMSAEIKEMLTLLAEHHQNASTLSHAAWRTANKQKEEMNLIKPIVESLVPPVVSQNMETIPLLIPRSSETSILTSVQNLDPFISTIQQSSEPSAATTSQNSEPFAFVDGLIQNAKQKHVESPSSSRALNMIESFPSYSESVKQSESKSGHKRMHSEGARQNTSNYNIGKINNIAIRKTNPTNSNHDNEA